MKVKPLLRNIFYSLNFERDYRLLKSANKTVSKIIGLPDEKVDYMFVVTNDSKHSGGATSYRRLISSVSEQGYTVAIVNSFNSDVQVFNGSKLIKETNLKKINLSPIYTVVDFWCSHSYFNYDVKSNDILFVQDRDYLFYPQGDCTEIIYSLLADDNVKKITLGDWIPDENFFNNYSSVPFPMVESKEIINRNFNLSEGKVRIAVFFKLEHKRLPYFMLENIRKLCANDSRFEVSIFGDSNYLLKRKYNEFNWKGFLNYEEMMKLLEYSHIGICSSVSNISLLPFEMITSGLVTVQNNSDVVKHFFGNDAYMFDPLSADIKDVFEQIMACSSDELLFKTNKIKEVSRTKTANWEQIGKEFVDASGIK